VTCRPRSSISHKAVAALAQAVFVLALAFVAQASAKETVITATVVAAPQETPVKIVGFVMPDRIGDPPKVIVHNASEKRVVQFYAVPLTADPENASQAESDSGSWKWETSGYRAPCAPSELHCHPEELRKIPPGGDARRHVDTLRSYFLANQAKRFKSNCLHTMVFIERVEFDDGTKWVLDPSERDAMWRNSIRPESLKSCANQNPQTADQLSRMQGAGGHVGTPIHIDPPTKTDFQVSCTIHEEHGLVVAYCDQ